jgi:hypothetical protein
VILLDKDVVAIDIAPTRAEWLVFLHTSDVRMEDPGNIDIGQDHSKRGEGHLGEHAATYTMVYQDNKCEQVEIRRRHQVGAFQRYWGENCFEAVCHQKPRPIRAHHEQTYPAWGRSQVRATPADEGPWSNWLWAWQNPNPDKEIVQLRIEPVSGKMVFFALSAGRTGSHPLRWLERRKAVYTLPVDEVIKPDLDEMGLLEQIKLDLGQVISASPRLIYPTDSWVSSYINLEPHGSQREILIEYTAHPDACFHLANGKTVSLSDLDREKSLLRVVRPASRRITIKVRERDSDKPVPVKLHIHGEEGEYLAPVDRHRIPNHAWFEDYSVDFVHLGNHYCTYIPGETQIYVPPGRIYLELSKGFEIRPVRMVAEITPKTENIEIELEKVLPWRERGWVAADTHVHFLSPISAMLEGSAEGVNVVNLLASQWGELMTNVGDFDGKTTWGSREAGGEGEYLVRVGTENRQHVLGHISLLGYSGNIIAPMTTGGPDESAIGDPVEVLLTQWARQCRQQGGLVVIPHFPNPRGEHAATIISGDADGIEMTSWGDMYSGINPYSVVDWYRYLNCGYLAAVVGGTDKMCAATAVGTVRTYAHLEPGQEFTYEHWMKAVRRAETFVSYGPLLEFSVEGRPMGSRMRLNSSSATVEVEWKAASVVLPMSRVELVVNGEIRESVSISTEQDQGSWSIPLTRSSWLALLVRGHHAGRSEVIAAHSSPVMVELAGSEFYAAADALTILEQIEGAMAFLDTIGTRAQTEKVRKMRMVLESAHRELHNRMHRDGVYHDHSPIEDHCEHH